jgi:hypothetical protein
MPRSAAESVPVDYCLPLDEIAPLLVRLCTASDPDQAEPAAARPHEDEHAPAH